MSEELTTAELFRLAIESRLVDLHVAMPAKVTRYDVAKQVVDVQPVLMRSVPRGEDLPPLVERLPVIQSVPVIFPRGGGFFMALPLVAGDYVLLVFPERDIGQWRVTGSDDVNPGDQRLHPLAGAVALPGIFKADSALQSASATALTFGADGGLVVTVTDSTMGVGGDSEAVALASRVDALEGAFKFHTHPAGTPSTAAPTLPVPGYPLPSLGYGSEVLKVGS